MWSLLPTPLRKRILIWAPLAVLVILWHLLLLWLVIGYRGSLYQHHLIIDTFYFNKDIRTVVVPLVKNIAPVAKTKTGALPSVQAPIESPSKASKVSKARSPKEIKTKSENKSSDAVVVSPVASKKTQKTKTDVKKKEKESSPTIVPAAKETPIKKEVALPKSVPAEEKKKQGQPVDLPSSSSSVSEQLSDAGAVIYIGREDAQAQQLYNAVYEAVRVVWTPPPGFGAEVKTQVEIILNWDGSLQKYTVLQSSGVPLFDACVRRDSKKIIFPRGAWGKTWILTFSNDTKVIYE